MNISEVAKMAGVSTSAVSRYLNNGYISEEKRQAIKAVIEKTGYEPSKQAQTLRTKKSKVIGVVVPKISSETISKIVSGISLVISGNEYLMLLTNTENNTNKEIQYLTLLNNNPVDGIVFVGTMFSKKLQQALAALNVPIVIIGQVFEHYPSVYHDDYNLAKDLTKLLINSGRKNLGILCVSDKDEAAGRNRTNGFKDTLKEYGLSIPDNRVEECQFEMDAGYEKMQVLLSSNPELDGVFCATDLIAVGALEYLKEIGKRVPEDIGLVSVGYSSMSRIVTPKLTTAYLHYKTSGIEATKMLLEMIEEGTSLSKQLKLGYKIVEGESV